jgi:hypothetical protein
MACAVAVTCAGGACPAGSRSRICGMRPTGRRQGQVQDRRSAISGVAAIRWILHGLTAGLVTPAIAAISLGLVGRRAMSVRTGRNYRLNVP